MCLPYYLMFDYSTVEYIRAQNNKHHTAVWVCVESMWGCCLPPVLPYHFGVCHLQSVIPVYLSGGERRRLRRKAAEVSLDTRATAAPAGRWKVAHIRRSQLGRGRKAHHGRLAQASEVAIIPLPPLGGCRGIPRPFVLLNPKGARRTKALYFEIVDKMFPKDGASLGNV